MKRKTFKRCGDWFFCTTFTNLNGHKMTACDVVPDDAIPRGNFVSTLRRIYLKHDVFIEKYLNDLN